MSSPNIGPRQALVLQSPILPSETAETSGWRTETTFELIELAGSQEKSLSKVANLGRSKFGCGGRHLVQRITCFHPVNSAWPRPRMPLCLYGRFLAPKVLRIEKATPRLTGHLPWRRWSQILQVEILLMVQKSHSQPTWDDAKTVWIMGFPLPTLTGDRRISEPSTVFHDHGDWNHLRSWNDSSGTQAWTVALSGA